MSNDYYRINQTEFICSGWSVIYIFNASSKETLLYSNYFRESKLNQCLIKTEGCGSQTSREYYNHIINNIEGASNC